MSTIVDALFVLQYMFVEGPMIPQPYPDCGVDLTVVELRGSRYSLC
jgi:hypothetical protein